MVNVVKFSGEELHYGEVVAFLEEEGYYSPDCDEWVEWEFEVEEVGNDMDWIDIVLVGAKKVALIREGLGYEDDTSLFEISIISLEEYKTEWEEVLLNEPDYYIPDTPKKEEISIYGCKTVKELQIKLFNLKQMANIYWTTPCYPRPKGTPYDEKIEAISKFLGEFQ